MKSEHRHELKTNELAEWLRHLPQWARENLTTIIYVSVGACLVITYSFWYYYQKNTASVKGQFELTRLIRQLPYSRRQILRAQSQGIDLSYTLIQTADNLQAASQNTKDDIVAASLLIKRADVLRMELHSRPAAVSREDAVAQIDRAKTAYQQAIEKAKSDPSLAATATFGLGLCEEDIGNFDQAQQVYRDITTNPAFECTTAAVQAKNRLSSISQYQQNVIFKTPAEPVPTTPPPQTESRSAETLHEGELNSPDSNAE
jgi:tetratricopeptide (TPR) repeat protein